MPGVQARRWLFTWYPDLEAGMGEDEAAQQPPLWDPEWMTYLFAALETCPTTGRWHWQSYVETAQRLTMQGLKNKLDDPTVHVEMAEATSEANVEYCSKTRPQDTVPNTIWVEMGEPMQQGKRSDLRAMGVAILAGDMRVDDVLVENPHAFHVYGRTLDRLQDLHERSEQRGAWAPPVVHWYWGAAGLGKSRSVFDEASTLGTFYRHKWTDHGWFDNYKGEKVIVFDEFRGQLPFAELLELLDGYPTCVPRRNFPPRPWLATHIFVTSNKHPGDIYDHDKIGEAVEQLHRRISVVRHYYGVNQFNEG